MYGAPGCGKGLQPVRIKQLAGACPINIRQKNVFPGNAVLGWPESVNCPVGRAEKAHAMVLKGYLDSA